jgi:predicted transcriptional regulator
MTRAAHTPRQETVSRASKREQLRRDALAAWDDYRANGLHLTEEEADAWLARLEVDEDAKAPECHI